MPKREIGEFKVRGFVISMAVFLAVGWFIYSRFSFKAELPAQQQEIGAQIESLVRRIDQLEQRMGSAQKRVEELERKVELGRSSRKLVRRGSKR